MNRRVFVICIAAAGASAALATRAGATTYAGPVLKLDTRYDHHIISSNIYGMDYAPENLAKELQIGVNRWGGDFTTRYNYTNHSYNTADDYYYENQDVQGTNDDVNPLIGQDIRDKVQSIIDLPTMGYVAKDGTSCSYPTAEYGPQKDVDPYHDCGDGLETDGTQITADPTDTSQQVDSTYDNGFVTSLVNEYGTAAHGGVQQYELDQEPGLWGSSDIDVHPEPETDAELISKDIPAAVAIHEADPGAQIVGPSDWNYYGLFYDEATLESNDNQAGSDEIASNGGLNAGQYFLQQMAKASATAGARLLNYFDVHYYGQESNVALSPAGSGTTQYTRLQSTRALWDPTYKDPSWQEGIAGPLEVIPRIQAMVKQYYPGTKTSLGEYNFGGLESINGALAEADALGIFARTALDQALIWDPPTSSQPGAYAFRMYRDYDGHGSKFGTTWERASSGDQTKLAVYAAGRSDHKTTVMVINKTNSALKSTLDIAGISPKAAARYQYSVANLKTIQHLTNVATSKGTLTAVYPSNSITLWVM